MDATASVNEKFVVIKGNPKKKVGIGISIGAENIFFGSIISYRYFTNLSQYILQF